MPIPADRRDRLHAALRSMVIVSVVAVSASAQAADLLFSNMAYVAVPDPVTKQAQPGPNAQLRIHLDSASPQSSWIRRWDDEASATPFGPTGMVKEPAGAVIASTINENEFGMGIVSLAVS